MKGQNEILQKAIDTWGEKSQIEMAQEEATELALACRKYIRKPDSEAAYQNLIEEIADVEIMISQLKLFIPACEQNVRTLKVLKLQRLDKRLS